MHLVQHRVVLSQPHFHTATGSTILLLALYCESMNLLPRLAYRIMGTEGRIEVTSVCKNLWVKTIFIW
jgi:hypothetical protein